MLANRQNDRGRLPGVEEIAFALRIPEAKVGPLTEALVKAKLIDKAGSVLTMHDWQTWQPPEKTSAQRSAEWRENQKSRALNGSAHRALEPSAPEKRERREDENEIENESAPLPPTLALGPEFTRLGFLAEELGGNPSFAMWVAHSGRLGFPVEWIESALRRCPKAKLNVDYLAGILRNYQREGGPPKSEKGSPNGSPKPEQKPLTAEEDKAIKERQRKAWPARQGGTKP